MANPIPADNLDCLVLKQINEKFIQMHRTDRKSSDICSYPGLQLKEVKP